MRKSLFGWLLWACPLFLAACSSMDSLDSVLESKKVDYKSAKKLPPLEIPPDLTQTSPDDRFTVPDISPRGTATFSAYNAERTGQVKTSSGILPGQENIWIESAGTQRWLVVRAQPDDVWPIVREFWQEMGFIIDVEKPEAGIMETDWAENRANLQKDIIRNLIGKVIDSAYETGERDKFRTRLEHGKESGTTEIFISHRGMIEVAQSGTSFYTRETVWQPREADPELEAEMLRRLMVRFGVEEQRATTLIANAKVAPRASITRGEGGGSELTLFEPFDRAWRRISLALDRIGFTVEDRNRAEGLYYVRYIDPQQDNEKKEDKGFLSKFVFWKSDSSKEEQQRYRIHVFEDGDSSEIRVLNKDGEEDNSDTANRILSLLYDQLQ